MEHRASAATASRKLFAGKSAYDGVFAAPAKVGTAVEDYREIFGGGGGDGSRGSSIPVLDVPELREGKVSVDVRSSEVDYADIFGGFGDLDYAVSLEELIGKLGRGCSSPEEARTPGFTSSPSEVLNPSNQASSNETPCQSIGEAKQVNMLYQKTNAATKNGTPGTTHIAQLHAIPGYTRLIDENISSRKIEDDGPLSSVRSDIMDCVDETNDGKWSQKSMSDLPPGGFVKQTSQCSVEVQRRSMQNESFSNGIIFDENDFGLGTYPPQVQPPSNLSSKAGNSERESKGSVASDFESSTSDAADAGASSPPYFGEEVDENSVAAASAAAVKLAIEKAQARMRLAKELMERKKEGLQSGVKLIFKDGLRAQKKRGEKVAAKANILEEEKVREVNNPIKLSDWIKKKDDMKVGEVTPDSGGTKELFTTKAAVEGKQKKEINIAHADHMPGEMKERETEPFCELVRTGKHSATSSETDQVIENISSTNGFELGEIRMAESRPEKPIDDSMQYEVAQEVHEWEDGVKKLYTYEGETELEVMQEHEEPEKKLVRAPPEQDVCDEKRKETPESMGILQNVDAQDLKENKNTRLEENHEGVENGKTTVEAEEQEECTNALENIHEMVTEVGILEDICRKEENGKILDESCGREENEMEPEEPCKWEENEKQQNDADGGGNTEKSGVGIHDQEIIGKATNTLDEGEESEEYFEDSRSEEIEQLEGEENEKELGEDKTRGEEEEETCEWTDTAEIWNEAFKYHGNNLEATDDTCRHDEHEHLSETKDTCMQRESDNDDEATSEATSGATSSFEARDSEKGSESSVELANDLDYNEIFDTNNVTTAGGLELDEMMKEANDTCPFNANGADLGNEENRYNLKANYEEERWACSTEAEAAQQPSTSETSQSSQKIKENDCETSITEERETKYTGQREAGLDKEHFKKLEEAKEREKEHAKKLDEAKEREKEREKERMVVERAIREARERAFAEARERAAMEKLTAEARRKQVTEAREKQGKASAEANYQSSAEKEAKLKAERAAVERATAEARERALAKAKSGKSASDAQNQTEKFSGGSRDDGTRQSFPSSDTQSRASCPNSSNSELAQRAKAELERQQRTSERAAKALAEKNMRDLLAQKEQAERNRLGEALNADIKRWSSGKEKNLRALLSTLHYILGADSGWQPVPLTDIVATAAVKKTYRRATLIVHPDKLQQRGASIQQKYLCEKVFDLLKEAWEKFNKEER